MDPTSRIYFDELVKYAVWLYSENDWHTAGFYASSAFESCIAPREGREDTYFKRVDRTTWLNPEQKGILNDCIGLRNKAIHEHLYKEHRAKYIDELIESLCLLFQADRERLLTNVDYEDIKALQRKYIGDSNTDVLRGLRGLFCGFEREDFRNLYEMRNKMYFLMADLTDYCQGQKPQLKFDTISKTISAYVWLAAVYKTDCYRPKIEYPSLSVLATNTDVRVYLDFGGRCKNERRKYYKLLFSKKGMDFLKKLDGEFCLFDIYWYFNIENRTSLQEFYEKRYYVHNHGLEDEGLSLLTDFESDMDSKKTIPYNKLLLGKVYSAEYVIQRGRQFADDITDTFTKLLPIFKEIQRVR